MDINKFKKWFSDATKKVTKNAKNFTNETLEKTWKKILNSKWTVKDKKSFDLLIEKSKNKNFTDEKTWENKIFTKRSILIIWKEDSDFFKNLTYEYPILITKTFSQNVYFKLSKEKIDGVNLEDYGVNAIPAMIIFENEKVLKVIESKENIQKLVKSFKLDINKEIDLI